MSEAELAEKFNRELDALLTGAEQGGSCDRGALDVAAALAAADFSGDSVIRDGLRARLTVGEPGFISGFKSLFSNNYVRAALAAACVAVALLPLARRAPGPAPAVIPAVAPGPGPAAVMPQDILSAAAPAYPELPPPPRADLGLRAVPKPDTGLFAAVPMGRLEGERISRFPIQTAAGPVPLVITAVKEIRGESGSGVAWETETTVFELSRQPITLEDLFQIRSL